LKKTGPTRAGWPSGDPAASSGDVDEGAGGSSTTTKAPPRAALLLVGSPREILSRIVQGDPLALRPRLAHALRERAVFVDADRVLVRALASCARNGPEWRGRPPLSDWLDERVAEAIEDVLDEDADRGEPRIDGSPSTVVDLLAAPLGLDPARLSTACSRFNKIARRDREAFFLLVVERRTLEQASESLGLSATETACAARRGLDVFLHPVPSPRSPALEA